MDVGAALVADGQAAEAVEPGERALDHPAVATERCAGVDALAGDADPDVAPAQRRAAARDVVALVGVQLGRALAPPPVGLLDRRDGIEQRPRRRPSRGGWPRSGARRAGCRPGRPQHGASCPVCRDPSGSARRSSPPFWPGCWPVQRGPAPVDAVGLAQAVQQRLVQARPRPRPPASRAAGASRSRRSRSPAPGAASPRGCRSSARR